MRADMARRGISPADLKGKLPIEVTLQTDQGYPHQGALDYAAPTVNASTGTLALENADRKLLPGYFARVRVPLLQDDTRALLVPDTALGSDQGGRYVLVVNAEDVVEQRKVTTGPLAHGLRVIETGLHPEDRIVVGGLTRAIPGQKVEAQMQQLSTGSTSPLNGLGIDNNLYVQIGLILLIALSAKNAILIVEVGRELRMHRGKPIVEAAVEAARTGFRPILMTSLAFILGVVPLVIATGAGASARKSIRITVFSGMLASTCLAVLFVPSCSWSCSALRNP
jgi:hypothetical protein